MKSLPLLFVLPFVLIACASTESTNNDPGLHANVDPSKSGSAESHSLAHPPRTKAGIEIAKTHRGRPILYTILGGGTDTVFLLAVIHGNEDAGAPLLEMLITHLQANPSLTEGKRVIILPNANPDGRFSRTRGNANGIDLNRNFNSSNFNPSTRHGAQPLSEPESQAIQELLNRYKPTRVFSIHQPLQVIDFDGPGQALADRLSNASGLPVKQLGSRPGSLGSYVGLDLGVPILTIELPSETEKFSDADLWRDFGPMVLEAVAGMEQGKSPIK